MVFSVYSLYPEDTPWKSVVRFRFDFLRQTPEHLGRHGKALKAKRVSSERKARGPSPNPGMKGAPGAARSFCRQFPQIQSAGGA